MSRGGGWSRRHLKCYGVGGSDKFSIVNYFKLNVMGRGVIRNQMLGGGGLEKTSGPPPIVILNGTALTCIAEYGYPKVSQWFMQFCGDP